MTNKHEEIPSDETAKSGRAPRLSPGAVLVAYEKLFSGGRGVRRFAQSNLRYVKLDDGAILVEQNPDKKSEWATPARNGHRVAWVMRNGAYLARIVDGEVVLL